MANIAGNEPVLENIHGKDMRNCSFLEQANKNKEHLVSSLHGDTSMTRTSMADLS